MAADPLATPGGGSRLGGAVRWRLPDRGRFPDSVALPHRRRGRIPTCREPLGGGFPIRWRFPTVRRAEPRAAASGWVAVTRFGGASPPFEGVETRAAASRSAAVTRFGGGSPPFEGVEPPPTDGKRLTIGQPPPMLELAPAGPWTDSFMAANPLSAPAGGPRLGEPFGGSYPIRWRFPTVRGGCNPGCREPFGGSYPMRWRFPTVRGGCNPGCREPFGGSYPMRWSFPTV
jgi:hypothetical protein